MKKLLIPRQQEESFPDKNTTMNRFCCDAQCCFFQGVETSINCQQCLFDNRHKFRLYNTTNVFVRFYIWVTRMRIK